MIRAFTILLIAVAAPVKADITDSAASKYLDASCVAFLTFLRDPGLLKGDAVLFYAGLKRGIEFKDRSQPPLVERYARSCTSNPTANVGTVLNWAVQQAE
ncbi:hypothetical protein ACLGGT_21505 [Roseovarius sp. MS2]|uniref:hypothetical protein n=1 Tax=Roseovarius sp. MS2 TaxID=3390728 RepID=UPI003EDC1C5E